jgi:hypothetical protein
VTRALGRESAVTLGAALLAVLPGLALVVLAWLAPVMPRARAVTLNLGPNDAAHVAGFVRAAEIDAAGGTRWAGRHARVTVPLVAAGEATLGLRFARVLPQAAQVDVRLGARAIDRFTCRGGRYEARHAAAGRLRFEPLEVRFDVDAADDRGLGLRLDWVSVQLAPGGVFTLDARGRVRLLLLGAALGALLRLAGFGRRGALAAALALGGVAAVAEIAWPLVLAHLLGKLTLPCALAGCAAAALLRGRPLGRWAVLLFVVGYLVKGAGVFHPDYYYPDVHLFERYVFELAASDGGLAERGVAAQTATNTAYPRFVAGRAYAFPYSPLFFVPFTWLPADPALVQDAQRHVALVAAASEVLLAFWLAGLAFGRAAGVGAALVAVLLPPLYSRLLYAMWPTLGGHVLDVLAIGAALRAVASPSELRRLVQAGGLTCAALLLYVSSLFNLGGFFAALALAARGVGLRLLALYTLAAALTVALLYGPFVRVFFGEILPAVMGGARMAKQAGVAPGGLAEALARVPMFYGWGAPALALGGFVLLWRRAERPARLTLTAYALAFALLVLLRAFGAGLFRDLKEITFVSPLVGVLAGAALEELWGRGRAGRIAAVLTALGLLAFCAERYVFYFTSYRAPAMLPFGAP